MLEFYYIKRGLLIVKFSERENTGSITYKNSPDHLFIPQNLAYITIVFDFSWDDWNAQEKLKTMVMQNFGGKRGPLWSV